MISCAATLTVVLLLSLSTSFDSLRAERPAAISDPIRVEVGTLLPQ